MRRGPSRRRMDDMDESFHSHSPQRCLAQPVVAPASIVCPWSAGPYNAEMGVFRNSEKRWPAGGTCARHAEELRQWATEGVSLSEMGRRIYTNKRHIRQF